MNNVEIHDLSNLTEILDDLFKCHLIRNRDFTVMYRTINAKPIVGVSLGKAPFRYSEYAIFTFKDSSHATWFKLKWG